MVRVQNRGKVPRGPFFVQHSAPATKGTALVRPGRRHDDVPEVATLNFQGSITFGAYKSDTDTFELDPRDITADTPLGRAIKDRADSLVILKDKKDAAQ